jgi:hypothetical protein
MRTTRVALFLAVFGWSTAAALAMPDYLEMFRRDPFRRPTVDGCNTCHMSPTGGDARNAFGQAFENGGLRITALLRAQFPDRFAYPTARGAGGAQIHFSDPNGRQVVMETGGTRMLVDLEARSVDGVAAAGGSSAAPAAVASSSQGGSDVPVDPYAREGAFLGSHVVNLPNGKPMRAGSVDFAIQHRFSLPICVWKCSDSEGGPGSLFGFDSAATVAYGGRVAVTDRLSFGVLRTNSFKTIEISSMLSIARQGGSSPLTFAVRAGVEGRRNFHESYASFVQPIVTRTFADRVSFTASPTFAFNSNRESFLPPEFRFGEENEHTIALGLGTGIRFLKTTSLVGEYIPRLWGYKGEIYDQPGVAFGLQKSTFRHTFELAVHRQSAMTTAQYSVQGDHKWKVGFNIYRRVR